MTSASDDRLNPVVADEIPDAVHLAAFRLTQEGLTNVMKHGGTRPVQVRLSDRDGRLLVEVRSALVGSALRGSTRQPDRPGHGLLGLRERVLLLGGTFEAGPVDDQQYRLFASIPLGRCHDRSAGGAGRRSTGGPAGLATIIDTQADLEVVGQTDNGAELVEFAQRLRPDVEVTDIRMPVLDGIEATRRLAGPDVGDPIPVLVLTTFNLDEYVLSALQAGASGFLAERGQTDRTARRDPHGGRRRGPGQPGRHPATDR